MNSTLQKFILDLVEKLKQENKFNDYHDIKEQIDIPFIISTLSQSFKNNEGAYKEFISDIEDEYSLFIKLDRIF